MSPLVRPRPPADLPNDHFSPAPELAAWIAAAFVEPGGPLHDPDAHGVLGAALIGCLWTTIDNGRPGTAGEMMVAGRAERPKFDGDPWTRGRREFQLVEWFGDVPDFLLTFHAASAEAADDRAWCALVDHELRHCGQARDRFGAPRFTGDGAPIWTLVSHDVEEFAAVVRRWGVDAGAGRTRALVDAGADAERDGPLIGDAAIRAACGADASLTGT